MLEDVIKNRYPNLEIMQEKPIKRFSVNEKQREGKERSREGGAAQKMVQDHLMKKGHQSPLLN